MSLVAYDSSDESDSSETDVQEAPAACKTRKPELKAEVAVEPLSLTVKPTPSVTVAVSRPGQHFQSQAIRPVITEPDRNTKQSVQLESAVVSSSTQEPHISDEEDDFMLRPGATEQESTFGLQLPAPKTTSNTDTRQQKNATNSDSGENRSSLLGLPQPKARGTTTIQGPIGDDTLEDMVKPKAAELQLAAQLKPPGKKSARQPVKITIPELPDPDSDEDEPQSKKPKPGEVKSGLFSLLPAPKHASIKEKNRPLIPHTLTRKPASSASLKKAAVPAKKPKALQLLPTQFKLGGMQDEDSDEEDAAPSTNFFSLSEERSERAAPSCRVTSSVTAVPSASAPDVGMPQTGIPTKMESKTQDSTVSSSGPHTSQAGIPCKEIADAPLEFKKSFSPPVGPWGAPQWGSTTAGASGQGISTSGMENQEYLTNQQYNYANMEEKDYPTGTTEDQQKKLGDVDMEQLLRLQGKSRASREQINIIDVHADDQVADMDITKALTQESEIMMSHSKKKNKDMPSGQQKRKHQITYLAFKAKEREIQLKNQWADSRASRKQTQSKYGF